MVFIVSHRTCVHEIFDSLHELFDPKKIFKLKCKYKPEDLLATKLAILLYKALKDEKTREVYL